eukprot:TRINITY_DN43071_c0_g1_i1.p1 TRINITY_DN43071_c0_g1~~TRINITY_DN43071_c0_g1_i1.p1  ORF type:complete len:243 (-),score=55.94 TRINITY_DN43071_c0_g1_i1:72-800(-)
MAEEPLSPTQQGRGSQGSAAVGSQPEEDDEDDDAFEVDDESTLRKVLFEAATPDSSMPRLSDGPGTPQFMRRRSRHTSLGGARGTVCVPVRAGLCEQQVQGLREIFGLFDPEASGRVCPSMVRKLASDSSLEQRSPEIWRLLAGVRDSEEPVDFEDFVALLTEPLGDHSSKSGTSRLLNLIGADAVAKDSVGLADLQHMVSELGIEVPEEELEDMLQKAGCDAEGRLSVDDFYEVMRPPSPD